MRLGFVAVVLLAACGPMPEDAAPPGATIPVRVSRLSLAPDGDDSAFLLPTDDLLDLRLRLWGDDALLADLWYRDAPQPFAELGEVPRTEVKKWRFSAEFTDATGQHTLEQDAPVFGSPVFESMVLCIYESPEQRAVDAKLVLIDRSGLPPPGASLERFRTVGTEEDPAAGPELKAIGLGRLHTEVQTGGQTTVEVGHFLPSAAGLYHVEVTVPRSRWIAANVLQLDQYVLTDDFAITR
jgi:hypothetical protein